MIWIIVLALIFAVVITINIYFLPKAFLKFDYQTRFKDMGVKNINEVDGHSIIYFPESGYRKHLRHYALSRRDDVLSLICDFDKSVEYAEYEVCLYGSDRKIFKVLRVKQIVSNGECEPIVLPDKTAFVSVKLRRANTDRYRNVVQEELSDRNVSIFAVLSSVVEVVALFAIKFAFAKLVGGLFAESFMADFFGNVLTFAVGISVIVFGNLTLAEIIKRRNESGN